MPRVYYSEIDRRLDRNLKQLHGQLLAENITNKIIAKWLNCSPQNVGYLWKTRGFSYKQYLIMEIELEKVLRRQY